MSDLKEKADAALNTAFGKLKLDDRAVYDVFWRETDGSIVTVPWKSDLSRQIDVEKNDLGAFVNAAPLPDGTPAGEAIFAGSVYRAPLPAPRF